MQFFIIFISNDITYYSITSCGIEFFFCFIGLFIYAVYNIRELALQGKKGIIGEKVLFCPINAFMENVLSLYKKIINEKIFKKSYWSKKFVKASSL